jgi:hypothetical protein
MLVVFSAALVFCVPQFVVMRHSPKPTVAPTIRHGPSMLGTILRSIDPDSGRESRRRSSTKSSAHSAPPVEQSRLCGRGADTALHPGIAAFSLRRATVDTRDRWSSVGQLRGPIHRTVRLCRRALLNGSTAVILSAMREPGVSAVTHRLGAGRQRYGGAHLRRHARSGSGRLEESSAVGGDGADAPVRREAGANTSPLRSMNASVEPGLRRSLAGAPMTRRRSAVGPRGPVR